MSEFWTTEAVYEDQPIERYTGNPLIESLPPILSGEEFARKVLHKFVLTPEALNLPPHLRQHEVSQVRTLYTPLGRHIDLEQAFSEVIREGYVARNPAAVEFAAETHDRIRTMRGRPAHLHPQVTASGFYLIGVSGIGKTTAVRAILGQYPDVIRHREYRGRSMSDAQLVWLHLECPHNGSLGALCRSFFQAVDKRLGTAYMADFYRESRAGRGYNISDMIGDMARVAAWHHLGVLVIDEIQFLTAAKKGEDELLLNFFTNLINTLGLPVVLIGTYKALEMLRREVRLIRRGSGQGEFLWGPLSHDIRPVEQVEPDRVDRQKLKRSEWNTFLKFIWPYQFFAQKTPLTNEISDALFAATMGITDFAVKVFIKSQNRAISGRTEVLTPELFRNVVQQDFVSFHKAVEDLRQGNDRIYEDMYRAAINQTEVVRGMNAQIEPGGLRRDNAESGGQAAPDKPRKKPPARRKGAKDKSASGVIGAGQQGDSIYDGLRAAGYIKSALEFHDP